MNTLQSVPNELSELHHWINWRLLPVRNAKPTKKPVAPVTGRFASVSDPTTWNTFELALRRFQTDPHVNGVGFVFTSSDPYTGIDFDHCRNPENGEIDPSVLARTTALDSYTEISVSGTGLHVIVQATLHGGGRRKNDIEIYNDRRFFVVTGNHLVGTPITINSRQGEIDVLYQETAHIQHLRPVLTRPSIQVNYSDDALVDRILRSRQGDKFRRLLAGDITGYHSHSEADLGICAILAFWTRDNAQINRIFCGSGLYRPKWDLPHGQGGLTYGAMTILRSRKFC